MVQYYYYDKLNIYSHTNA